MGIESPVHLLFIAVVALLVLGPRRLPELARRIGDGVRDFRDAMDSGAEADEDEPEPPVSPAAAPAPGRTSPAAGDPPGQTANVTAAALPRGARSARRPPAGLTGGRCTVARCV